MHPLDRIKIFSRFSYPQIEIGGEVEKPGNYPFWEGITLRDVLGTAVLRGDPQHLKVEIFREEKPEAPEEPEEEVPLAPPSQVPPTEREALEEEKRTLEAERMVLETEKRALEAEKRALEANQELLAAQQRTTIPLSGVALPSESIEAEKEMRVTGRFIPVRVVYLYDLVVLGKVEVNFLLEPGIKLIVKPVETGERVKSATILGRVQNPGVYTIQHGDRLSDLIEKAGGFTEDAYPPGVVFLRESVQRTQEERLTATMLAIEEGLIRQTAEAQAKLTPEELQAINLSIQQQRQLLENMRAKTRLVLGRVAIHVPGEIEKFRSTADDLQLEDGDEIYVPKLPDSTIILGEVYNPVALAYKPGKSISYYLNQAGGLTKFSDTDEIFVIKADGTVMSRRQKGFVWKESWDKGSKRFYFAKNFEDIPLDPGDTIVIPTKVEIPILWRPLIRDVVQIAFQTAAIVAIIAEL